MIASIEGGRNGELVLPLFPAMKSKTVLSSQRAVQRASLFSERKQVQLELHPSAAERIDELAKTGRAGVESGTMRMSQKGSKWTPDRPTTTISRDHLVGPVRMRCDGSEPFFYMHGKDGGRVVRGESARALKSAVSQFVKAIKPKGSASFEAVRNLAEDWAFDETIAQPFSEYAVEKLSVQIRPFTAWIPIANLAVQSTVPVGQVEFRPVTSECLSRWYKSGAYATLKPEMREAVDQRSAQVEKKLRGNAAGIVDVVAEPIAARELALGQVRTALNVLTFFSPELIHPTVRNHCAPHGQQNIEEYWVFLEADGRFVKEQRGLVHDLGSMQIDDERIEEMRSDGLDQISGILLSEQRSEYQSRLLASITLYAESSRERRFTSRLVLMLAALEGLFLKNASESIQQNLGERIAVLLENSAEKRIEIVKLVRQVYYRRSKFVHHSEHVELDEDIEKFAEVGWHALRAAIDHANKFDTPKQFVDSIDYMKMGGST